MRTGITAQFRSLLEAGLGLFYPAVCQVCEEERATAAEGFVGPNCWNKVHFITPPFCARCGIPVAGEVTNAFVCSNCHDTTANFTSARAAVVANPFMLQIIHRYKYGRALYFEPFLADLLIRQAAPLLRPTDWDLIVPVPLHPVKKREREFNQAEHLAIQLSRATKIPLNKSLVRRVIPTLTQTMLNREQRAENVKNAFAPHPKARLQGERIILIDDVMTTCATTNACAKALRQAGAGEICVWTVARGS